jgi:hypothetical protein
MRLSSLSSRPERGQADASYWIRESRTALGRHDDADARPVIDVVVRGVLAA